MWLMRTTGGDFGATYAKSRCHAVCTTILTGTSSACSSPERYVVLNLESKASSCQACLHGFPPRFYDRCVVVEENM